MLLSSLYVYFRDMAPIWEVVSQVLFYSSPVIIPILTVQEKLGPTLGEHLHAQPDRDRASSSSATRSSPTPRRAPPSSLVGGLAMLGPIAIAIAIFALGFVVFNRSAPYVAENL